MKRKPEWMIMYQELVDRHHDGSGGRDKAPTRHAFETAVPCHPLSDDEDMIEWCIAHANIDCWTWGWDSIQAGENIRVFSFQDHETSVLFGMVWR